MQIQLEDTTKPKANLSLLLLLIFTAKKAKNTPLGLQNEISEEFSFEQLQVEEYCLKLKHQKRKEASNQILQNQKLERYQLFKQLNQPDTVVQDDNKTLESTQVIHSTSKTVLSQHVASAEFSEPAPFTLHVRKE